jgi:RNA polymerase sigma-70 factor (ECF subfamily)
MDVSTPPALLELYDEALPQVYGYLLARCGDASVAEDLTAECFLAAVVAQRKPDPPPLSTAWLIGVARHKLVDHWRARSRDVSGPEFEGVDDPWDEEIDAIRARDALAKLAPAHRAALTLRYLDGLPVAQVAAHLDRTLHATEALLVRARRAFRQAYLGEEGSR